MLVKRDNIHYLAVGSFVIISLAALLVAIALLSGRTGATDAYYLYYQNVAGVKFGTPVYYEGFQVGQVEEVEPRREAGSLRYRLRLHIRRDWPIPEDSVAKMTASGLLSAISIEIHGGQSGRILSPGGEIASAPRVNLLATLNDTAEDFRALSRDTIRPLVNNLQVQLTGLLEELRGLSKDSVRPLMDKLRSDLERADLVTEASSVLTRLNGAASSLQQWLGEENRSSAETTLANLEQASGKLHTVLLDLHQVREHADRVLDDVEGMVGENRGDLRAAVGELRQVLTALSQRVDTVGYHLEGSSRNIHEFTRQIRENPALLISAPAPQKAKGKEQP